MPNGVKIRIGNQSRELRFGPHAVTLAERLLGGESLETVVFNKRSLLNVTRIAAAGFTTQATKVSPPQVEGWVASEPGIQAELERCVLLAVSMHLVEAGKMTPEDFAALGESLASGAPESAGSPASGSADATGSTPSQT